MRVCVIPNRARSRGGKYNHVVLTLPVACEVMAKAQRQRCLQSRAQRRWAAVRMRSQQVRVVMVRTDSAHQKFKGLAGKRIAIPSHFAVDFLFPRKMLAREGMTPKEIQFVEMAPADMPAAQYAKAVDAYRTGEPFAAAQHAGYARPLRMTRDEWRNYVCCVQTVREEPIQEAGGMDPAEPEKPSWKWAFWRRR